MPRKKTNKLGRTSLKVLELIDTHWPTSASEIGRLLEPKRNSRAISMKYIHHIKRLRAKGLINSKRMGNTLVVWPKSVDKLKERLEKLKAIRQIIDSL